MTRSGTGPGSPIRGAAAFFVLGLLCTASGIAPVVLPGAAHAPAVLLGLWIWSTEVAWA